MFILFALHHAANWHWHKNIAKGKYSPLRFVSAVINTLLCFVMFVLSISGILKTKHTLPFLDFALGISVTRVIHLLASYWGFVLMSFDIGLHGSTLFKKVSNAFVKNPQGTKGKSHFYILATIFCIYGAGTL